MVLVPRSYIYRVDLLHVDMLDCTKQPCCKSSLWDGHGPGIVPVNLRLVYGGLQFESAAQSS